MPLFCRKVLYLLLHLPANVSTLAFKIVCCIQVDFAIVQLHVPLSKITYKMKIKVMIGQKWFQ